MLISVFNHLTLWPSKTGSKEDKEGILCRMSPVLALTQASLPDKPGKHSASSMQTLVFKNCPKPHA